MAVVSQVKMRCVVCHRVKEVSTTSPKLYDNKVVEDNYVCLDCQNKVKKVKVDLVCDCGEKMTVVVLSSNVEKIKKGWKCLGCASGVKKIITKNDVKSLKNHKCAGCRYEKGVCVEPSQNCAISVNFIPFNCTVCTLTKACSVLTVFAINKGREDIHCVKYDVLDNKPYLIDSSNVIMVRQRKGSQKNSKTHISLFKYYKDKKKFGESYNKTFEKGGDGWIKAVRDEIISYGTVKEV